MASSMPPGAHVQYIRVCQNPALSYLSPSPFLHPHSFHPAQSLHSLSVCLLLLCRYIYPQVLAVEASLAACSAATSGQRSLLLIPTASGQFSLPTAFCLLTRSLRVLVLVGHVTLPALPFPLACSFSLLLSPCFVF